MLTTTMDDRAHLIEARVDMYLHVARRMVMDQFGATVEKHHNGIAVELANAMVSLEAAHIIAEARQKPANSS